MYIGVLERGWGYDDKDYVHKYYAKDYVHRCKKREGWGHMTRNPNT
jgi:hypothetical protein